MSPFWGLVYWPILDMPYCLDIMHITKNVCESLLSTLLNMPERTKDGPRARQDLLKLGIRLDHVGGPPERANDQDEETEHQGKKAKKESYYCPRPASLLLRKRSISFSSALWESNLLLVTRQGRSADI